MMPALTARVHGTGRELDGLLLRIIAGNRPQRLMRMLDAARPPTREHF
jgi:hypothetical protein